MTIKSNRKSEKIFTLNFVENPAIKELCRVTFEEAVDHVIAEIASGEVSELVFRAMVEGGWVDYEIVEKNADKAKEEIKKATKQKEIS